MKKTESKNVNQMVTDRVMDKKPTNFGLALYLAENYRERMKSDEHFKKVARLYNMRWRVLKKNFEEFCWIIDELESFDKEHSHV